MKLITPVQLFRSCFQPASRKRRERQPSAQAVERCEPRTLLTILDPSFESVSADPDNEPVGHPNWAENSSQQVVLTDDDAYSGSQSAEVNSGYPLQQLGISVDPNSSYSLTLWTKTQPGSGGSFTVQVTNGGVPTSTSVSATSAWTQKTIKFTTHNNTTIDLLLISNNGGTAPLVDLIQLTKTGGSAGLNISTDLKNSKLYEGVHSGSELKGTFETSQNVSASSFKVVPKGGNLASALTEFNVISTGVWLDGKPQFKLTYTTASGEYLDHEVGPFNPPSSLELVYVNGGQIEEREAFELGVADAEVRLSELKRTSGNNFEWQYELFHEKGDVSGPKTLFDNEVAKTALLQKRSSGGSWQFHSSYPWYENSEHVTIGSLGAGDYRFRAEAEWDEAGSSSDEDVNVGWYVFTIAPPVFAPEVDDASWAHTMTCGNYGDPIYYNLSTIISDSDTTLDDIDITVSVASHNSPNGPPTVEVVDNKTLNPRLRITPANGDSSAEYRIGIDAKDDTGLTGTNTVTVTLSNNIATPVTPSPTGISDGELLALLDDATSATRTITWTVDGDDVDWELYRVTTDGDAQMTTDDLELVESAYDVTTTSYAGPSGGYAAGTYVFQIQGKNCIDETSEWAQIAFMVSPVAFSSDQNSESQCNTCQQHREGEEIGNATVTSGSGDLFSNLMQGLQTVGGWLSDYTSPLYYANSPAVVYAELDVTTDTAVTVEASGGLDTSGRETTTIPTESTTGDEMDTVRTPVRLDSSSLTTAYGEIGTTVTLSASFGVPNPDSKLIETKTFSTAGIATDQPASDPDASHAGTSIDFAGFSRLDDTDEGPVLHRANGTVVEFDDVSSGYEAPDGSFLSYGTYSVGSDDFQTITTATGEVFTYNDDGLLIKRESMTGGSLSYIYEPSDKNGDGLLNDLKSVTDDDTGEQVSYEYDSGGRVDEVRYSIESGTADDHVWAYAYKSGTDLLESITGPDNEQGPAPVLKLAWSTSGTPRLTSITKTDDQSPTPTIYAKTSFEYDSWGNVSQVTEESTVDSNRVWQISSAESRLLSESTVWQTAALDGVVKEGAEEIITLPNNDTITREVDEFGKTVRESRTFSNNGTSQTLVTEFERNSDGQIVRQLGPYFESDGEGTGDETKFTYDSEKRLTQIVHPDGSQETWIFEPGDGPDQPFSYTNQLGHYTRYVYDLMGRRTIEETYAYDGGGARVVSKFEYEWDGEKVTRVFNYHGFSGENSGSSRPVTEYFYDSKDRLIHTRHTTWGDYSKTSAAASATDIWISQEYDAKGFLEWTSAPYRPSTFTGDLPSAAPDDTVRTNFTSDARGNVLTMTLPDPDGPSAKVRPVYSFEYDPWSQMTLSEIPGPELVDYRQTDYDYNQFMELTEVTTPDPDGAATALTETTSRTIYDELGHPEEIQILNSAQAVQSTTHVKYNSLGLTEWVSLPYDSAVTVGNVSTAAKTRFEYDQRGRVAKMWEAGGYTGADATYVYDDQNRTVEMTDAGGEVWTTTYDVVGRVVEEKTPDPAGSNAEIVTAFTYRDGDTSWSRGGTAVHGTLVTTSVSSAGATGSVSDVRTLISNAGQVLVVEEADPDGSGDLTNHYTTLEYDVFGRMTREADHNGASYSTAYSSADTRETEYTYDVRGRVTEMLDVDPDGSGSLPRLKTVYNYDNLDRLTSEEWARPETAAKWAYAETVYDYNVASELVSETRLDKDSDSTNDVALTFTYDHLGRIETESRPNADNTRTAITKYAYNQRGDLKSVTLPDPDGDTNPRLSQIITYAYGSSDPGVANSPGIYLTSETAYAGNTSGGVQTATTIYGYDDAGRMDAIYLPVASTGADGTTAIQKWSYDDFGRVETESHLLTNGSSYGVIDYNYDELGRLTSVGESGSADSVSYVYDGFGRVESVNTLIGVDFTTEYDGWGRPIETIRSANSTDLSAETTVYDDFGRVKSVTQAEAGLSPSLSQTTSYEYDFKDRLTQITDPLNYTEVFTYRAWGPILSQYSNEFNQHTYFEHDSLYRLLKEEHAQGGASMRQLQREFTYNSFDEVEQETRNLDGASDAITTYIYDDIGLLTRVKEPNVGGATTETDYEYDRAGNLTSLTDPVGNETVWEFDARNRVTKESTTVGASTYHTNLSYWDNDLLQWDEDRNGDWQGYDWEFSLGAQDLFNVTLEKWWDASTAQAGGVAYEYDSSGSLLESITTHDNNGGNYTGPIENQVTFSYDDYGRLTATEDYLTGDDSLSAWQRADTLTYYDALDRITNQSVQFRELSGGSERFRWDHSTAYTWDGKNRVTAVTQHNADAATATSSYANDTDSKKKAVINYFKNGQIQKITRTQGEVTGADALISTYGLHAGGWVPGQIGSITHSGFDNVSNQVYTWTYETGGRVSTFDAPGETKKQYVYDDTDQLIESHEFGNSSNVFQEQDYDSNGNLTGSGITVDDHNRLKNDGTYSYEYDNEGQRTKRTLTSSGDYEVYDWDYRGRLISVSSYNSSDALQQKVAYDYDGMDRRIRRQVDTTGNGTYDIQERLVYVRNVNDTGYDEVAMVLDETANWTVSGGAATFSPEVEHRLMNGPMLDQVFADEVSNGDVLWYLHDNQYTVRDVAKFSDNNSNGAVDGKADLVNHLTYNDFGEVTAETNSSYSPLTTYTGQILDEYTGLMYYDARWFDPEINQFLTEDPLGFAAGDPNLRRYVGNSNPNAADPSGLFADDEVSIPVLDALDAMEKLRAKHEDNRKVKEYHRGRGQIVSNVMMRDGSIPAITHQIDDRVLQQLKNSALASQRQIRPYSAPGNDNSIPLEPNISAVPYRPSDNTRALIELEAERQMLENSRNILMNGIPIVGTWQSFKGVVDPTAPWYDRVIDGVGLAGDVAPVAKLFRSGNTCVDITRASTPALEVGKNGSSFKPISALNTLRLRSFRIVETSPVRIPGNAKIRFRSMPNLGLEVRYKWTDAEGFEWLARFHDASKGAPATAKPSWVLERIKKGNQFNVKRQHDIFLGDGIYVPLEQWKKYQRHFTAGTATDGMKNILKRGHFEVQP